MFKTISALFLVSILSVSSAFAGSVENRSFNCVIPGFTVSVGFITVVDGARLQWVFAQGPNSFWVDGPASFSRVSTPVYSAWGTQSTQTARIILNVDQDVYPEGYQGQRVVKILIDRSSPNDRDQWAQVMFNDGSFTYCK